MAADEIHDVAESPLRRALAESGGGSLKSLTVLSSQNDPFRVDTPARHRDGAWLTTTAADLGLGDRKIHCRGLHYMVLGRTKPNGEPYTNTDPDWLWLSEQAAKAARWLGYVPFEQITDERNSAPEIRLFERPDPWPYISVGIDVEIPDADDITPMIDCLDFAGVQPYKLILFGEKHSLDDVLAPIAEAHKADLYLPKGELSDTLIHTMASTAAADGRPLVVLCFSDCDPAGWQMPISIGRKLQAFKAALFPEIEFEVHRVVLTPDQVREFDLPSTPLKPKEKRANAWTEATGLMQTEVDALLTMRPDAMREIALAAIEPFYDESLDHRVDDAARRWRAEAQQAVNDQLDTDRLDQIRADAAVKLGAMREEIARLNDALRLDANDFTVPTPTVPTAAPGGVHGVPLLDSRWSFTEQCRALIASKEYREVMSR